MDYNNWKQDGTATIWYYEPPEYDKGSVDGEHNAPATIEYANSVYNAKVYDREAGMIVEHFRTLEEAADWAERYYV